MNKFLLIYLTCYSTLILSQNPLLHLTAHLRSLEQRGKITGKEGAYFRARLAERYAELEAIPKQKAATFEAAKPAIQEVIEHYREKGIAEISPRTITPAEFARRRAQVQAELKRTGMTPRGR